MKTASDIAIGVCVAAWLMAFVIPIAIPGVQIDATVSLVLMALTGAIIAFRQGQEDVGNDGRR